MSLERAVESTRTAAKIMTNISLLRLRELNHALPQALQIKEFNIYNFTNPQQVHVIYWF